MSSPSADYKDLSDVVKSPLDSNVYKAIQLCSNDLKVLMISNMAEDVDITGDRHAKATCAFQRILEFNEKHLNMKPCGDKTKKLGPENKSSKKSYPDSRMCRGRAARGEEDKGIVVVSLTVGAGKMNDPVAAPGLAHFCEHAILCGSKNYPELEALQNYITENGGECNARTEYDSTTYFFKIYKESLEESLMILVDCIVRPNMDKQLVMKELSAVESEFGVRKNDDDNRFVSLLRSCAKDGHPCGNFGDGNELSLNIPGIYETLLEWKDRNYRGNYMTLVIKGPIPIPKLQSLIIKVCSEIPRGDPISPAQAIAHHGTDPFDAGKWTKLYKVLPFLNQDTLKVTWYLEPEYWKNYKTKPLHYMHWLIEQKAKGGLAHYLKRKGWIFNICATCPVNGLYANNFVSGFTVQFILTNDGIIHYVDVLKALFSYIKMLVRDHTCERLYNEFKFLMADLFHYMSDRNLESPFGLDDGQYDGNFLLMKEFSEILQLNEPKDLLLSKFLVSDFDVPVISSCLSKFSPKRANYVLTSQEFAPICNLQEKWYGTKYCVEEPTFIADLENVAIDPEMLLPEKNKYLDESLCYPLDSERAIEIETERLVLSSEKAKIYYVKSRCIQGYLPTAKYFLLFNSAEGNSLLQGSWAMIDVLTRCLEQIIHLHLGSALNALINCDFYWQKGNSLELQIFGPSNKLPEILEIALQEISNLHQTISPQLFENMAELAMDNIASVLEEGEKFAEELQTAVLSDRHISAPRHQQFLSRIKYDDFMEFCSLLKRRAHIYGELYGCVTKSQSKQITKILESMTFLPWKGARWFCDVDQAILLPVGERCLRISAPNINETNSVTRNHYQLGKLNTNAKNLIIFEILEANMDSFVFENLRTRENLGYIVELAVAKYMSVNGLTITVICEAEKFTTGYIDERIDATVLQHYEKFVEKQEDFEKYLKPRLRKGEKVSHADMKKFYQDYFLPGGTEYKKLSIQVVGHLIDSKISPKDTTDEKIQEKIQNNSSCEGEREKKIIPARVDPSYPYKFLLPSNLRQQNGYFMTDIQLFKNKQFTYGLDAADSPNTSDSGEDDDDDEDRKKCAKCCDDKEK